MSDAVLYQYLAAHFAWSLLSCGTALASHSFNLRPFWLSFWRMTGVWGFVHGCVGVAVLLYSPLPVATLGPLLRVMAGLNGLCLATGAILATRPDPRWSGSGLSLVVQSLVMLVLDLCYWLKCESAPGP